ncbi:hypothetical protein PF004_g16144 [Phytophthora fragariae]|uniref:Ig-like domain-containing protein n=1 Tax=Phytophthora fragariae TaxID=53985 RepID=A0A6G0NJ90_9STRA|nr:hypothetical protein PF004_g16144 [Phytophthora fragariae]
MGLLQLLLTVVVAVIVFSEGIASTSNEITATESSVLQNKTPTSAGAPPTRELVGDDEERGRKGGRVRLQPTVGCVAVCQCPVPNTQATVHWQ